jgi:exodeoxyribonuclease-5
VAKPTQEEIESFLKNILPPEITRPNEPIQSTFSADFLQHFPFQPNTEQNQLLRAIIDYLNRPTHKEIFIVKGAAGTGKTSLICGLIKFIQTKHQEYFLSAPTGRAARVFSIKANADASTIHHLIYRPLDEFNESGDLTKIRFELKMEDAGKEGIYFVDEASMISDTPTTEGLFQFESLLDDLLQFVFYQQPGNKLILMGDDAQLPPVADPYSPALQPQHFLKKSGYVATSSQLNEVQRQSKQSSILWHAHEIRKMQDLAHDLFEFQPEFDEEVVSIPRLEDAVNAFVEAYLHQPDETIFLTYSNAAALRINQMIRKRIWGEAPELPLPGEKLLVVRNHYKNAGPTAEMIANGEQCTLLKLNEQSKHDLLGLEWADLEIEIDTFRGKEFYQYRTLLSLLQRKEPRMLEEEYKLLLMWARKEQKMAEKQGRKDRSFAYINALQVKYGYCITGHKAQGGEWKNVFLFPERPYGSIQAYTKWLYTTFTRASERLYLVG